MSSGRETIRWAVLQKLNATKGWNCASISELYDRIKVNIIVKSLRLCDPAVGSGHFLVMER